MSRIFLFALVLALPQDASPQSRPAMRQVPTSQPDPTLASPALRNYVTSPAGANQPAAPTVKLRGFTRRGYIETDELPPLAIYEVEDCGLVMLQQGGTVTITSRASESTTVLVKRLTVDELLIEFPDTGKTIIFH